LVAANLKELGLSVVEAAKAIGVIRQQLFNVINGRSAVTPEMAVRFEKALGGATDVWLRMQAATTSRKCASPKERSEYDAFPGMIAVTLGRRSSKGSPRTTIETGARTLIAARQGFTDTEAWSP
jgi:addiction module HigA family antidote